VEIGGAFLAVGDGLGFAEPVEPHDCGGADHADFGVLVFQGQPLRFSVGGVGDEGRLVLDARIGVAVAELGRAERVEGLGVGRNLSGAECLDVLRDGIFIRRSRGRRNDAEQPNGESRQG
jgi:hypothetical protein